MYCTITDVMGQTKLKYDDNTAPLHTEILGCIGDGFLMINSFLRGQQVQTPVLEARSPQTYGICRRLNYLYAAAEAEKKPRNDRWEIYWKEYEKILERIRTGDIELDDSVSKQSWATDQILRYMGESDFDALPGRIIREAARRLSGYGDGEDALRRSGVLSLLSGYKTRLIAIIPADPVEVETVDAGVVVDPADAVATEVTVRYSVSAETDPVLVPFWVDLVTPLVDEPANYQNTQGLYVRIPHTTINGYFYLSYPDTYRDLQALALVAKGTSGAGFNQIGGFTKFTSISGETTYKSNSDLNADALTSRYDYLLVFLQP